MVFIPSMFKLNEFNNSKLVLIRPHFILFSSPQHIIYSSFIDFFNKQFSLFDVSNPKEISVVVYSNDILNLFV